MNTPSIRPVLNIKLMLLSIMHIINLMNRKLGNQLGLFCSSASGLMCAPSQPARRASRGPCRRCSSPITPASLAGGASPSPEVYAAPGNAHVLSSVHAHAAGWCGRGFGAGGHGSHCPQAHCRCRHMHVRAAIGPHRRPARPPAHTGTSVSREALKFAEAADGSCRPWKSCCAS